MTTKTLIFDLDGVIVDTAHFHFIAWQRLAAGMGIDFNEEDNEQLKGVSRVNSLNKILEWGGITLSPEAFQAQMHHKNEEYLSLVRKLDEADILPGVYDFLLNAKKIGCPIALGSASKNARLILKQLSLLHMFDVIVDGTDVTTAKPNPEVFLTAAGKLGTAPERCVVFEDSIAGIDAAIAGGMHAVGIGDNTVLNRAHEVYASFPDMPGDYLQKLNNA